ncbi:MAG: hypothetical protein GKR88_17700 [Flavobacteriaceae bacterium]|nr:MAG: hypothetical protein GKR88_17700 [Flavobacteriaceae bacterium]
MTPENVLHYLSDHEKHARASISFVPSENTMSPISRLPFILDNYSRYHFDYKPMSQAFRGDRGIDKIKEEILIPLLQELTKAEFINLKGISGMNCLTVVLAALTDIGDTVISIPANMGGHPSTPMIAKRLGIRLLDMPMLSPHDLDLDRLETMIKKEKPRLIYIDQSTFLFPIDPMPVRQLVDQHSPATLIHFDSSHLNGLVLGGACWNALDRGADSFGGSTHKTLPGPHKTFLASNQKEIIEKINDKMIYFVSHIHAAGLVSLTLVLLEMKHCGCADYAKTVVENSRAFASLLHRHEKLHVAEAERGFTDCHQLWVTPELDNDPWEITDRLHRCGLLINNFDALPGINAHTFRLSMAEATKLGLKTEEVKELAEIFIQGLDTGVAEKDVAERVKGWRLKHPKPEYGFTEEKLKTIDFPFPLEQFLQIFNP